MKLSSNLSFPNCTINLYLLLFNNCFVLHNGWLEEKRCQKVILQIDIFQKAQCDRNQFGLLVFQTESMAEVRHLTVAGYLCLH